MFIDGNKNVSYGDFLNWSGKYAGILSSNYDICKGDRVMCRTSKTLDSVALYLACLQLGAIYIPVNPSYTQHETEHFVEVCGHLFISSCFYIISWGATANQFTFETCEVGWMALIVVRYSILTIYLFIYLFIDAP
ncbi:unnamed protein product [Heligmosomoides polygyrus]|uniref:AMP-dependent synthetase/ligase domain-containing protein n=1 Tax=Heligmosomoides polygyrus TaxID=6339 RepID=A0A3P7XCA3_HELPZ|nr:unnamed protein product [Heligmosomoides polygyrus]